MYVITVRPKAGELDALSLIPYDYQQHVIPNFTITDIKEVKKVVNKYYNPLWLDIRKLQNFSELPYIEQFIKEEANYKDIKIVYPLSHVVTHSINSNHCVRITFQELSNNYSWNKNTLNKLPNNILIDLNYITKKSYQTMIPDTSTFINMLNNKNIIISSGSIPKILGVDQNTNFNQRRYEKLLFQQLSRKSSKDIIYGDYGIISPEQTDINIPRAIVQLKYTQKENYLFVRNGARTGNYDIKSVAQELTSLPDFNEEHCQGEKNIVEISHGMKLGNTTNWLTYGMNHHIILCIEENLK